MEKERLGKCFYKRVQLISAPQKNTGIGTSALAKISAWNMSGDHSKQSRTLKNRIKIFFRSFSIEVNFFQTPDEK